MPNTEMDLTTILKLNTDYELLKTAATEEVVDTPEIFEFAVPEGCRIIERIVVLVEEVGDVGDITAQVLKGDSWAAKDQPEVTCGSGKTTVFSFEPGPAVNLTDGTIQIKLTPDSGLALAEEDEEQNTGHGATIAVILIKGNKR